MNHIKCPDMLLHVGTFHQFPRHSLFLGGGISCCPDWQEEMVKLLEDVHVVLVNPRREKFDIDDKEMSTQQIKWEHYHLAHCRSRLFWFPKETLCPITLFELGKFIGEPEPLFVGCHPEYKRKLDVEVQMSLYRQHDCQVSTSLPDLADRVKLHMSK